MAGRNFAHFSICKYRPLSLQFWLSCWNYVVCGKLANVLRDDLSLPKCRKMWELFKIKCQWVLKELFFWDLKRKQANYRGHACRKDSARAKATNLAFRSFPSRCKEMTPGLPDLGQFSSPGGSCIHVSEILVNWRDFTWFQVRPLNFKLQMPMSTINCVTNS